MKRAIVLWNKKAGANEAQEEIIRQAFHDASLDLDLRVVAGQQLREEAKKAATSRPDVIVAAGGDGTISAVAGALLGGSIPLGVLPLGTLNHFAKDLAIPLDTREAVALLAQGDAKPVDVAEVNGRVFVNNSSLGMYPRIVREREDQRSRLGRNKWLALFLATLNVFRRFPTLHLRLDTRKDSEFLKTPLIFVGNNEYTMELFSAQGRTCLDRGQLSLYLVKSASRFGLLRLSILSMFGGLRQDRDFSAQCLSEFWVESRRRYLDVAVDGEVVRMKPPLHYRTRPEGIRVIRPRPSEPEA